MKTCGIGEDVKGERPGDREIDRIREGKSNKKFAF